jgi:hypothetical protein
MGMYNDMPLWKTVWLFFKRLKIELLCAAGIPLLPKRIESKHSRYISISIFIAGLFTKVKNAEATPNVYQHMNG